MTFHDSDEVNGVIMASIVVIRQSLFAMIANDKELRLEIAANANNVPKDLPVNNTLPNQRNGRGSHRMREPTGPNNHTSPIRNVTSKTISLNATKGQYLGSRIAADSFFLCPVQFASVIRLLKLIVMPKATEEVNLGYTFLYAFGTDRVEVPLVQRISRSTTHKETRRPQLRIKRPIYRR